MKRKVIILDVIGLMLCCITCAFREYYGVSIIAALLAAISLIIAIALIRIAYENDI